MSSILQKAAKYKRISTVLVEGEAHLKDPLMPPPKLLKPNPATKAPSPDDVTDFPSYKTIPIPESIGYREGKYRPPSIPLITGTSLSIKVGSPIILISSKVKYITGVHAAWVWRTLIAMEVVTLQWRDVDLCSSTLVRVDITNYAIANFQQTLLSVMELIEIWSNSTMQRTEDSTKSGVILDSGQVLSTCIGTGIPDKDKYSNISFNLK